MIKTNEGQMHGLFRCRHRDPVVFLFCHVSDHSADTNPDGSIKSSLTCKERRVQNLVAVWTEAH